MSKVRFLNKDASKRSKIYTISSPIFEVLEPYAKYYPSPLALYNFN